MKQVSFLSILILAFFGCRNDIDDIGNPSTMIEPPIIIQDYNPDQDLVEGTIFGRVYDEQENPVADAQVTYDGKNYSTDEEGRFFIIDEILDKQGTFFTVEADGYFKGSRRLNPQDGSVNYAYVQLLALNTIGTFNTVDGGQIDGDDGISITFAPNSIISSDGTLYDGEVSVAAKFLDPTAPNIGEIMPGNLLGLNSEIEEVSLVSYGMMAAELFGENGEKLNIAAGQTARLSFPVPADLINSAPQEIPLWSFEEEQYGIWAEEGTATLQNRNYVGDVSHFSFWNCDAPFDLVFIEAQLLSINGTPLSNTNVSIGIEGLGYSKTGHTDKNGFFAGKVPKGEKLIMRIGSLNESCNVEQILLGAFDVDTNLNQITDQNHNNLITISGKLFDCFNRPILNSRVKIIINNQETFFDNIDDSNSLELSFYNCSNVGDVSIQISNRNILGRDTTFKFPLSADIDLGEVIICDTEAEFIFLEILDNKVRSNINIEATLSTNDSHLNLLNRVTDDSTDNMTFFPNIEFNLSMSKPDIGSFSEVDIDSFSLLLHEGFLQQQNFNFAELICSPNTQNNCTTLKIEVLESGDVEEFVYVEFNGNEKFTTSNGEQTLPFSGIFRARIKEQ